MLTKPLSCLSCSKHVSINPGGKIAICESCKLKQKVTTCKSNWLINILFQNYAKPSEKIKLTLFNSQVSKLVEISGQKTDLHFKSQDDLTDLILELESIEVTYYVIKKILLDIAPKL